MGSQQTTLEFHYENDQISSENRLSADILMGMLSNMQSLVYFLAARNENLPYKQRFKPNQKIKDNYQVFCSLPQKGSYTMPITINEFSEDTLFPHISIGKEITNIFKDAAASSMKYIKDLGFDYRTTRKLLSYIRNCFPSKESGVHLDIHLNGDKLSGDVIRDTTINSLDTLAQENQVCMTTVTGQLQKIDFQNHEITIIHSLTSRSLSCFYEDDFEESLLENRKELVQVTGEVELDSEDNVKRITGVVDFNFVDLAPITIKEFEYDDGILALNEKRELIPVMDETGQFYTIEDPMIGIDVFAYTRNELRDAIQDNLIFLWETYSNAKDEELTEKAKELKYNLLKHVTWRNK